MPATEVLIFADEDGSAPLISWMDQLPEKVQDKCLVRIERLKEMGHELRRPEADLLRDGIYELRIRHQTVHYRILYFFSDKHAILSHGVVKEDVVPRGEIDLAIQRKKKFVTDPSKYTLADTES